MRWESPVHSRSAWANGGPMAHGSSASIQGERRKAVERHAKGEHRRRDRVRKYRREDAAVAGLDADPVRTRTLVGILDSGVIDRTRADAADTGTGRAVTVG